MPGWVRGFVVLGILAIVLFVLASAIGGGKHGPSRHLPEGADGEAEPAEADGDVWPPEHP